MSKSSVYSYLSTNELATIRRLRIKGNSLIAISKVVNRSVSTIVRNTLDITNVNRWGKTPINKTELMAIRRMRNRGDTLDSIAHAIGRSTMTVYNYTKDIVNGRRRNRIGKVNLKTGMVGKHYTYC